MFNGNVKLSLKDLALRKVEEERHLHVIKFNPFFITWLLSESLYPSLNKVHDSVVVTCCTGKGGEATLTVFLLFIMFLNPQSHPSMM